VYLFREGEAPDPGEVVRENVGAVVEADRERFEGYRGRLHGYPDCCVDRYVDRRPDGTPPEVRSVEPLAERVDDAALAGGPDPSASLADLLPDLLSEPAAFAFFAREFFPGPGCERARRRGVRVYDALAERVAEALVRDYFRFNAGWSVLVAEATREGHGAPPAPGALGREHLLLHLPERTVTSPPRYG
jgi:hypothetical protein